MKWEQGRTQVKGTDFSRTNNHALVSDKGYRISKSKICDDVCYTAWKPKREKLPAEQLGYYFAKGDPKKALAKAKAHCERHYKGKQGVAA